MKVKATTLQALAGAVGIAAALSAGSVLAQAKEQHQRSNIILLLTTHHLVKTSLCAVS